MTLVLSALVSLVCLIVITVSARRSPRGWVELWAHGWAALSVGLLLAILPVDGVLHLVVDALAGAAFGVFGTALSLGVAEYITGWPVRLKIRSGLLAAGGAAAATLSAGVGLAGQDGAAVTGALVGVTAGIAGAWILASERRSTGSAVLGVSLALSSVAALGFAAVGSIDSPYAALLPVLMAGCGLGVALTTMESERDAAELAAAQVEHLAYHDSLTGLPNRSLFFDRVVMALAQGAREHTSVAVLFLDIDRFKQINDSLGHTLGDALLRAAAQRIRECLRPGDTLARFGGDEFTILLPRVRRIEEVNAVADRILAAVRRPLEVGERELVVTTSVGAAVYPSDGLDAETLVKNADTAMYRAKELGRDNCQLYTPELNSHSLEKLDLENRLRRAVRDGELVLHYQAIVSLRTGAVSGFEALIRWQHPDLGLLSPDSFMEAAEVSGLTIAIGDQTLRQACAQAAEWNRVNGSDLTIAVNLSARQLHEDILVEQIRNALSASGLPAHLLCLEVTETHAMRNAEASIAILEEIRSMGVRVALDDFGTGYSSLAYLQRLPVDIVKLDRSFIRGVHQPADAAIVLAVIDMARALGMQVVAEGVETERQLAFVREHGCDEAQGFLLARPVSAAECRPLLSKGNERESRIPISSEGTAEERMERRLSAAFPRPRTRHLWEARRDWINDN